MDRRRHPLYLNHLKQAEIQLGREPRPLPRLFIDAKTTNIDEIGAQDIRLDGYDPWPAIRAEVSV